MAEKRVIELEVKDNVGNLKQQYKEAVKEVQQLVQVYGETSQEVANAAKRAAELKDQIEDTNDAIAAFKGEGTYAAFGKAISSVASGFSAVEGAMGLVGVESEALQETLLRVQSAMALAQGLEGLEDAGRAFKQVGAIATNAFNNMTKASKIFMVTGIGLLLTGVGLLIANFDKLKQTFGHVTTAQEDLVSTMDAYREGAAEAIKQTTEVGNAFELAKEGVISKDEALHLYNETLGDSFGKAKNLNEAEKLYRDKTDAYIKSTALRAQAQALFAKAAEEQVKVLTAELEDQTSFAGKASAGLKGYFFGLKEGVKEYTKAQKEGEQQTKKISQARADQLNNLASSLLKEAELIENKNGIVSKNEKATQDAIKEANKAALEKAKERWEKDKEYGEKRIALGEKILEELAKLEENRKNKEAKIIAQSSITKEELYKREAERINKLREDEFKDAQGYLEAELIANQFNLDARLQLLDLQREKELQNKELTEGEITAIEAKYAEQRKQIQKQELEFKINAVQNGLSIISNLAQLFAGKNEEQQKRAFQVQKAVNIASAIIDTYKAANAALASAPPPFNFIQMAAVITAGLLNVKQIATQEFTPSGGNNAPSTPTPTSGGSTPNVITPNFNIVGNAQATNPLTGLGNQPIQAYVVSGEVTTAQNLDRNRINYATFG